MEAIQIAAQKDCYKHYISQCQKMCIKLGLEVPLQQTHDAGNMFIHKFWTGVYTYKPNQSSRIIK